MKIVRSSFVAVALILLLPQTAAAAFTAGSVPPRLDRICPEEQLSCVQSVISEMEGRHRALTEARDWDVVFQILYLRTTQVYCDFSENYGDYEDLNTDPPSLRSEGFDDKDAVYRQDEIFGTFHWYAFDAWHRGDVDRVPPVWQVAFEAAENADEYLTLGLASANIAAHVVRDLPLTLFELFKLNGGVRPNEHDHNEVNVFLEHTNRVYFPELTQRVDPSFDAQADAARGIAIDNDLTFAGTIEQWRTGALADALELWDAYQQGDQAALDAKYAEIEQKAVDQATGGLDLYRYETAPGVPGPVWLALQAHPDAVTAAERQTYFEQHAGDDVTPIPGPDGEPVDPRCATTTGSIGGPDPVECTEGDDPLGHHHIDDHTGIHAHHSHGLGLGHDKHHCRTKDKTTT